MFSVILAAVVLASAAGDPVPNQPQPKPAINPLYPNGRIVGGKPTSIEQHPWQASLQAYGFHFCGGSIISERAILTAGHCASYSPDLVTVRVGTSIMESGGSVHRVSRIVRHEDFENVKGIPINDVAVIQLESPIELDKTRQPIGLFAQGEEAVGGAISTISGWGALFENGDKPDRLRTVQVPIVTKAVCDKAYETWGGLPDGQICAAYPQGGKDTCQGDSGGPLVIDGRQAGIVSWGNGCARRGYPGVYTEVAAFRNWIAEHAAV